MVEGPHPVSLGMLGKVVGGGGDEFLHLAVEGFDHPGIGRSKDVVAEPDEILVDVYPDLSHK